MPKFIRSGNTFINPDHVAYLYAGKDRTLSLHLAIPRPALVPGVITKSGVSPPSASGHVVIYVKDPTGEILEMITGHKIDPADYHDEEQPASNVD